jgi:hypothetical protein
MGANTARVLETRATRGATFLENLLGFILSADYAAKNWNAGVME